MRVKRPDVLVGGAHLEPSSETVGRAADRFLGAGPLDPAAVLVPHSHVQLCLVVEDDFAHFVEVGDGLLWRGVLQRLAVHEGAFQVHRAREVRASEVPIQLEVADFGAEQNHAAPVVLDFDLHQVLPMQMLSRATYRFQ